MGAFIRSLDGVYILASRIDHLRRYAALDDKPGLDLYAKMRDGSTHRVIDQTNDVKEQALIDELGSWIIDPSMYEDEE